MMPQEALILAASDEWDLVRVLLFGPENQQ